MVLTLVAIIVILAFLVAFLVVRRDVVDEETEGLIQELTDGVADALEWLSEGGGARVRSRLEATLLEALESAGAAGYEPTEGPDPDTRIILTEEARYARCV